MHCDTPTTGKVNPPPPCPKSLNPSAEQLTEIGSEFEGEREKSILPWNIERSPAEPCLGRWPPDVPPSETWDMDLS